MYINLFTMLLFPLKGRLQYVPAFTARLKRPRNGIIRTTGRAAILRSRYGKAYSEGEFNGYLLVI